MTYLILGLIVFLGAHAFTAWRGPRAALIVAIGAQPYKLAYSVLSLAGFVLLIWGFGQYRAGGMIPLWSPPAWGRHAAMGLMLLAFIAMAATGKSPGRIRGWLRHPTLVGVKLWALAHLLANGDLGGVVLFGSFLAWAVFDRIAVKRRGDMRAERLDHFTRADAVALGVGVLAYAAMLFAHGWLIGVPVLRG